MARAARHAVRRRATGVAGPGGNACQRPENSDQATVAKPPNVKLGATVATLNRGRSLLRGLLVVIAFSVATFGTPSVARAGSSLFFGFSDDGPKWNGSAAAPGRAVGASAFRVTLRWVPGESDLSAQNVAELATAVSGTSGLRLVLAVYGSATSAPQNDI